MVSFSIIAAFTSLVSLSIAGHSHNNRPSPVAEGPEPAKADPMAHEFAHANAKRGALGVYECKGKNWEGPCTWTEADGGQCHNTIYGSGGSMGPDHGLTCRIYALGTCEGYYLDGFQSPGFPNYATNGWLISNSMTKGPASYKCAKS